LTRAQVQAVLANDVSWARMLQELSRTIPQDVWLTAFDGAVTAPGTAAPAPSAPASTTSTTSGDDDETTTTTSATNTTQAPVANAGLGTVSFTANGLDYSSVSAWLQRISEMPSFSRLFVPNAALVPGATRDIVQFNSTASLTEEARSDRLSQFEGNGR
jgi:Tfp pilus assembly protein PilN